MDPYFDSVKPRQAEFSYKWNRYAGTDILPCWVADAEFPVAPAVSEALAGLTQHGVLGYLKPEEYEPGYEAIVNWIEYRHGVRIPPEWIVWMPGVVPGFNTACRAFSQEGDSLVVQTPNYPPILHAHKNHGLEPLRLSLTEVDGQPCLDFDQLESQAANDKCTLMILCNPMNPNGKVISLEDMQRLGDICQRHGLILISDEIHCDLILEPGVKHTPAFSLESLQACSLTLMSAAKTFNIAGLGVSFGIIPDAKLRAQYIRASNGLAPWANIMGLVATAAAFDGGREWHSRLLKYLLANRDHLAQAMLTHSGLSYEPSEATFLAWVDARGLGVDDPQAWFESRGLGPSPGSDFASPGFARINFACPRQQLDLIIDCCFK